MRFSPGAAEWRRKRLLCTLAGTMAREQPHRRQLLPLFLEIPKGNDEKNVRRVVTFRPARVS